GLGVRTQVCGARNAGDGFSAMKHARLSVERWESRIGRSLLFPEERPTSNVQLKKMRRFSNRPSLTTLSEINITPLLDLAFVLLIIFMITTPLMENSVNLVIPSSSAANAPVNSAAVQTISIDRTEAIRLNNELIEPDTLAARLKELRKANP